MSIRLQTLASLTLLVLAACGGDDRPPPGTDSGTPLYDGGPRPDGFVPPLTDGDVPEVDGGTSDTDGGTSDTDGGGGDLCATVDCTSFDDACNVGTCDPADGSCSATPVADGTACDDTVACTMGDVCTAGTCGGTMVDCTGMSDMCNVGMCEPTSGACIRMPMADGTSCDDGSACSTGDACASGVCGGTAVDCTAMSDMCNVGTCDASSGACGRTPMADGTSCNDGNACTTGDVCTTGTCGGAASAIPGDTCMTRLNIPPTDGIQNFTGMITACNDNTSTALGCSGRGVGRDVVYRLVLPAARRVRFETTVPASGDYDTVLHLRTACGDTSTEVACDDDGAPSFKSRIVTYLEAGTYFLYVDAFSASATGTYNLTVEISTPDTCAAAAPIATPARGATVRMTGNTTGAANNFNPTCNTTTAPDHVYELVVATRGRYRIETIDPPSGAYDTMLQVRSSPCAGGAELECNDDAGTGFRSRIDRILAPGTYYIVVDGYMTAAGPYILEVEHQQGEAAILGHDFFARETNADRALANAIFSSNNRSPELALRIVDYRQFAGTSGAEEITNTQAVISERATALGRPAPVYTNLANYMTLNLADQDVLLVYEQEGTTAGMMTTVGTAWTTALNNFIRDGGTIVVLDYSGGSYEILDTSGLMTIPAIRTFTSGAVTVTTPADPIAMGVTSGYTAPNGSAAYAGSTGGTVVLSQAGDPLCRHLVR